MHLFLKLLLSMLLMVTTAPAMAAQTRDAEDYFFSLNTGDLRAELADARKAGKKALLVMFEQDGCPGCLYMKQNVLNRVDVQNFYRARFVSFSVNIFNAVPIKDLSGKEHTEKSFAQSIGIKGTPTLLFYDLDGHEAMRFVGAIRDVTEFMMLGEFVASGAYKSRKFAEYKSSTLKR